MVHKIISKIALITILPVFSALAAQDVPTQLFGVKLGEVYDVGTPEEGREGNIPQKKFGGVNKFLGNGIHYYFQPEKEYKEFTYIEKRKNPEDKYYETSFRLYMLPVIPSDISTIEQLKQSEIGWEVVHIEWSDEVGDERESYNWAYNLCKTFGVDIAQEPEILDHYEAKKYKCSFSLDGREFEVENLVARVVSLSFDKEVFEKKEDLTDIAIRKLHAKEIRPY